MSSTLRMLLAAVALGASSGASAQSPEGRVAPMSYANCLALIDEVEEELGSRSITVVQTPDMRVVRIAAVDGAVTLSCNRAESTVKLTKTGSARQGS